MIFPNIKRQHFKQFNYRANTINPKLVGNLKTTETDEGLHMDHVFSYENKFDSDAELLNAYVSYSYEVDDVNEDWNNGFRLWC